MKLRFVLFFLGLMLFASPLWAYIPREDAISNASTEADYSYTSAAKGTPQLTTNLYHPNYKASACSDTMSPLAKALSWPLDGDGNPKQHSWYGAPYCYGGTVWQSTCQTQITNGEGLGASLCHYNAFGSAWATGIDCSFFVCKCFEATYYNVAGLKAVCTRLYDWDPLQPGDLLISSSHVMIYGGFEGGSPIVYHACARSDRERVTKEILPSTSGYEPYRHFNIDPDDNVIVFLSHLTPYADGHGVTIDFATIFEENTSHFVLEKYSRENRHFAPFAKIMPKGSGSNYSYSDPSGSPDDLYRLVEVENSGGRNVLELSKVCDQKPQWEYSDIQPPKRDIESIRSDTERIIQRRMETQSIPASPSVWNYDWVVIYPDTFEDDVSDLTTWRWLHGFYTGAISIEDVISGYGSINGYVQYLWEHQNHSLEYVCLVGAACISDDPDCEPEDDLIPIDVFEGGLPHGEGGATRYASDFEVGDVTGDGYPEIAVGRIPAKNTYDVVSYINKLIHYESTSPGDWTDEVTYFVDAMTHNSCSGVAAFHLAEILQDYIPATYNLHFLVSNESTLVDSLTYPPNGLDYCLTNEMAVDEFNDGRALVLGFGNAANAWNCMNWMHAHLHNYCENVFCMDSLDTNEIFPLFIGAGCQLGELAQRRDNFPRPLVEDMLFDSERGAIAAFAPSSGTWLRGNFLISRNLLQYLFDWGAPSTAYACIGALKMVMTDGDEYDSTARSYIFFGDPAIQMIGSVYDDNGTVMCDISHSYPCSWEFFDVCPQGDADVMVLDLDFEFDFDPHDIQAEDITLEVDSLDSTLSIFNNENITADSAATAGNQYRTTISHDSFGGYGSGRFNIICEGQYVGSYTVSFKSADFTGDGYVSLSDMSVFGNSYSKCDGDLGYMHCCDFNGDSCCSLSDFSFFGNHYTHSYENYGRMLARNNGYSDLQVLFEVGRTDKKSNDRTVALDLSLDYSTDITDICFMVDVNNGAFTYSGLSCVPDFPGKVITFPITRQGKDLVMVYISSGENPFGANIQVGTLEFISSEKGKEDLASGDITLYDAEVMDRNGIIRAMRNAELLNEGDEVPIHKTSLSFNYPNPFNPTTVIRYEIAAPGHVNLSIFDVNGRLVRTLVDSFQKSDRYKVTWDGKNNLGTKTASGVYFYRLKTGQFTQSRKLVILK